MKKFIPVLMVILSLFVLGSCSQPFEVASDSGVVEAKAIGQGKEIIAYFCDWSVYGGHEQYRVSKIPFDKLTIINFSFLSIVDNVHTLFNGFKQYTQKTFGRTVQKYEAAWLDSNADVDQTFGDPSIPWGSEYAGCLGQLRYYKEQYPHLKVIPSIGGWTKGHMFSEMAANPAYRKTFVDSTVTLAREYNFDGVDIDWEYPGIDRAADTRDEYDWGCPGQPADTQNFTILMKELREAFDAASAEDNKTYLVTAAMGIGYDKFALTEIDKYPQYLDYINLMTYDMHGGWDSFTGHQAPIKVPSNGPYDPDIRDKYNIEYAIAQYLDAGVPASKLTLGLPFYTRGWKGVEVGDDASLPGLYEDATGSPTAKWDNPNVPGGCGPYFDIKTKVASGQFTEYFDPVAQAVYAYSSSAKEFYTYDNLAMIQQKCQIINDLGFGGAMIWEIDGDTWKDGSYELTNAVFDMLYNGVTVTPIPTLPPTSTPTATPTWDPSIPTFTPTPTLPPDVFPWESGKVYVGGDKVSHNGSVWKAKWWNQNEEPGVAASGVWELISGTPATPTPTNTPVVVTPTNTPTATPTIDTTPTNTPTATPTVDVTQEPTPTATADTGVQAWAAGTAYAQGDIVSYNGAEYECRQPHTALNGWEPPNVPALWLAL